MDYSFNCSVACQYGVDEAIFIHNLYWWIRKNEANGRHYYEGKNWTYNTFDAFSKLFPFWTNRQIERIIRSLKDSGAIYVGNFNEFKFDRTQWYALSEQVTSIYANSEMELRKRVKGTTQTVVTIPDSKPDSKQNIMSDKNYADEHTHKKRQKTNHSYDESSREMQLSILLSELMRKNNPKCLLPTDSFYSWCESFRLTMNRDGRDFEDMKNLIKFSQWHQFWKTNILSANKFREQYDKLTLERDRVKSRDAY